MRTRIPRFMADDVETPHKTGDFPPYIANDVGLIETSNAHVVVVFFSAHHRDCDPEPLHISARHMIKGARQRWALLIALFTAAVSAAAYGRR